MSGLLRIMLIVGGVFALIFVILRLSGALTVDQVEGWLLQARGFSPWYVGGLVVLLLLADLLVSVPTMAVSLLAGYFLGPALGALAAISGMALAGICGYLVSRQIGVRMLNFLLSNASEREAAINSFQEHGFTLILFSRAVPMLPEVSACLAGMTRMPFARFLVAWAIATVPYAVIATYFGSVSTLEDPAPAILAAVVISGTLWLGWFVVRRVQRRAVRA